MRRALVVLAFALLLPGAFVQAQLPGLPRLPGTSAPAAAPPAAAPSPAPVVQAIPLPQIADKAEDLDRRLEAISQDLTAEQEAISPKTILGNQATEIRDRALHVDSFIHNLPDILQLRDEVVYWRALAQKSSENRKMLTARAAQLQTLIALLDSEQATWQATKTEIHDVAGIEVVASRVQQELDAILTIRARANDQLNQVLTVQNELSITGRMISDSLTKLSDAEQTFRSHILERDGPPLWAAGSIREDNQPVATMLRKTGQQDMLTTSEFILAAAFGLLAIPAAYVVSLLGAFRLKQHLGGEKQSGVPHHAYRVLTRPYLLAIVAALLVSIPLTASAPLSVSLVFYLVWLGLIFRLTPVLVAAQLRPVVYVLVALNLLEVGRVGLPLWPGLNRIFLFILVLAALVSLSWLLRPSKLRRMHLSKRILLLLQTAVRIGQLLLGIALLANAFGYVSLSHVLGVGTLLSAFFAAALYCVFSVALMLLVVSLHSQWAAPLSADLRQSIQLWGRRFLIAAAIILWWTRSELYVFMVHDSFIAAVSSVLAFSIDLGKTHFTVGGVLTVILILGVGYGLAKGISSLLRNVLLAKLPLQRGVPYAISKVTYYCLLMVVFTAAIASAGVELNKFTVITGALGVGVGFGLQNIVSNFASGLILLFERPIRISDTIEVNGLVGTVKRIGARSSTISTPQGAEVIVPNSNLLSNHVINWTLSSPWRRVDVPVGVGYDSDPEMVAKLLADVAIGYPDVMRDPPPLAFFLGFGDSALLFELRFWSARQDTWFQLKSDVSMGVARALREAGIEVPFPQQDLHLRSVDPSVSLQQPLTINAAKPANTETPQDPA